MVMNTVKSSDYRFKPSLIITFLTVLFFPLLIYLGFWQLHRAEFKEKLLKQYNARLTAEPIPVEMALKQQDVEYLPVTIKGKPDIQHIILLDNRIYQHQLGYQVIVPIQLQKDYGVLVNWGWVPQGHSRNQLPSIQLPSNILTVTGTISQPPEKKFFLGTNDEPSHALWPLRLQQVDTPLISQKLGYRIAPFVVLLSSKEPIGYVRDWAPATLKPQIHLGYAFQWFALAVTLIVLFLISSIQKISHEKG